MIQSHGRLGNPKVSSGCKTCKKRKVKCDEGKPFCERCFRAKRLCFGYESAHAPHQSILSDDWALEKSIPRPHPSLGSILWDDGLFQFFLRSASKSLAGLLDHHFWTFTIPQLCLYSSSVRYSALALSAFLKSKYNLIQPEQCSAEQSSTSLQLRQTVDSALAMKYYCKAVKATQTEITESKNEITATTTCVLFFCIECLQGHGGNALELFRQGRNILRGAIKSQTHGARNFAELAAAIERMFTRVQLVAALLGARDHSVIPESDLTPNVDPFPDICESRMALCSITASAYTFYIDVTHLKTQGTPESHWLKTSERLQQDISARLQDWRVRSAYFLTPAACTSPYNHVAYLLLQSHYILNQIWLSCTLAKSELVFDKQLGLFKSIVYLCSQIIRLQSASDPSDLALFQLELGVALPLYVTACKCRSPSVRRRAILALLQAPQQEGFWKSRQLAEVSKRIVEIEGNQGCEDGHWPGEYDRVVEVRIEPGSDNYAEKRRFRVSFTQQVDAQSCKTWSEWLTY